MSDGQWRQLMVSPIFSSKNDELF